MREAHFGPTRRGRCRPKHASHNLRGNLAVHRPSCHHSPPHRRCPPLPQPRLRSSAARPGGRRSAPRPTDIIPVEPASEGLADEQRVDRGFAAARGEAGRASSSASATTSGSGCSKPATGRAEVFTAARAHHLFDNVKVTTLAVVFGAGAAYLGIASHLGSASTLETWVKIRRAFEMRPSTQAEVLVLVKEPQLHSILEGQFGSADPIVRLSPKVSSAVVTALAGIGANAAGMKRLADFMARPKRYTGTTAMEEDAVQTALKAFGIAPTARPDEVQVRPDYDGALRRISALEDAAIEHDARAIPGLKLVQSDITGRALFRRGDEEMEVFTANKVSVRPSAWLPGQVAASSSDGHRDPAPPAPGRDFQLTVAVHDPLGGSSLSRTQDSNVWWASSSVFTPAAFPCIAPSISRRPCRWSRPWPRSRATRSTRNEGSSYAAGRGCGSGCHPGPRLGSDRCRPRRRPASAGCPRPGGTAR